MIGEGFRNEIDGFSRVTIRASQGHDRAIVNAVDGQSLSGERNRLSVLMSPASPAASMLIGFDQIEATVDSETKIDVANVDYMFSMLND